MSRLQPPLTIRRPRLGLAAGLLVLALCLVAGAPPAAAQISVLGLKNSLVQYLLDQIGTPGAFEVTAGAVTEPEDGVTALNDVRVADANGVWLTVRRVSFSWTASALLEGRVEIDTLRIEGLRMERLSGDPDLEGGALAEAPAAEPFSWPRSPIALAVRRFELQDVFLAEGVTPQAIRFDGEGSVVDEGDAQSFALSLTRTDAVAGEIAIQYERRFDDNTLKMTIAAEEAPGGLVAVAAGLPEDSASRLSLTADGPPTDWRAELSAASDRVFSAGGTARIAYEGPFSADVDLALEAGETLDPALRRALSPEARLVASIAEGDLGLILIREASLTAADLDARIDGTYGKHTGAMDFTLDLEARRGLSDLVNGAVFERVGVTGALRGNATRFRLEGEAALDALATGPADIGGARLDIGVVKDGENVAFTAGGDATGVRVDRLGPDLIGPARLTLDGGLSGGALDLRTLRLQARPISVDLSGAADLDDSRLDLRYRIAAPDLGPVMRAYDLEATGALQAEGAVTGPFDRLAATGEARGARLTLAGERLGEARLRHRFTLAEAIDGDLAFTLSGGAYGAASAETDLRVAGDRLTVSSARARAFDAEISGGAEMDLAAGLATGGFDLAAPDLRRLGAALDAPLSGGLSGRATLSAARGAQAVDLALQADRLSVDGARFATGPARLRLADAAALSGIDAGLDWTLTRRDGAEIGALALSAAGSQRALDFKASAELQQGRDPVAARVAGVMRASGAARTVRIESAEAGLGEGAARDVFRLLRPVDLRIAGAVLSAPDIALALPRGGALQAALERFGPDGAVASFRLTGLDLALLKDRFDAPLEAGAVSAEARLDTRPRSAGGQARIEARGVTAGGIGGDAAKIDAAKIDADLDAVWDGRRAAVTAEARGADVADALTASFSAPLRPAAGGGLVSPPREPIDGALRWRGEIAEIWPLIPAPDQLLSGAADVDLAIGGTLAAPSVSGRIGLLDGRYENLEIGAILTDLTVASRIEDAERIMLALSAQAGEGRIESDLSLDLGASGGPRVEMTTALARAQLAKRDDLSATVSGEIAASGPVAAARVTGALTIDSAEYRLIGGAPPEVADLGPIRYEGRGAPPAPEAPVAAEDDAAGGPTLDLTITAPRRIFVRGRGLETEWRADLAVTGRIAAPRIQGGVERVRGRLDLLGRRFEFSRGLIGFDGGRAIDPSLDVVFTREANDIEGQVLIGGRASAPSLAFASDPALPEEEVLPRVLFGRAKQSLSAAEAFQLASGVATLMSGEAGLLDRARDVTGLDVLDYGETAGGGEAVTAGRYVGDGVFVGARQPIDGRGGAAIVELEVFDGVSVDAEVGRDSGSSVGASWSFDF